MHHTWYTVPSDPGGGDQGGQGPCPDLMKETDSKDSHHPGPFKGYPHVLMSALEVRTGYIICEAQGKMKMFCKASKIQRMVEPRALNQM